MLEMERTDILRAQEATPNDADDPSHFPSLVATCGNSLPCRSAGVDFHPPFRPLTSATLA